MSEPDRPKTAFCLESQEGKMYLLHTAAGIFGAYYLEQGDFNQPQKG